MMDPPNDPRSSRSNELDAERKVIAALDSGEEERLWEEVRRSWDEDRLMQVLAEEAPRMTHRFRRGLRFSELLLVAVVERDRGAVVGNTAAWKTAEPCLADALGTWLGGPRNHTVFRQVMPYEWIAAWGPSIFREHLTPRVPPCASNRITFHPEQVMLPDEAPRLGFIVLSVTSEKGWPALPVPNTLRDARFRDVVGHAFGAGAESSAAVVLAPDQVSAALADGVCLWLAMLHDVIGITAWDMSPCASHPDAVRVSLTLEHQDTPLVFPIRRHQLGPVGVDCIACVLASLAGQATIEGRQ